MRLFRAAVLAAAGVAACSVYPVAQDPDGMALRRNANQVLMALQAWRHDRGGFPAQLSELVPAYLPALPDTPAMHYRQADGSLSFRYIPTWPQLRPVWCSSVGDTTNWNCQERAL
ncbi:MAG TPA: hypothetical protein VHT03_13055 [Rhizomicrobium sp.]|jgi:hypothetical protein|nr:hypothetical protein [Rhizomicrobium sp.]